MSASSRYPGRGEFGLLSSPPSKRKVPPKSNFDIGDNPEIKGTSRHQYLNRIREDSSELASNIGEHLITIETARIINERGYNHESHAEGMRLLNRHLERVKNDPFLK